MRAEPEGSVRRGGGPETPRDLAAPTCRRTSSMRRRRRSTGVRRRRGMALRSCLTHGDSARARAGHRLGDLSGVIDWEEVGVGDPAMDFAWWLRDAIDRRARARRLRRIAGPGVHRGRAALLRDDAAARARPRPRGRPPGIVDRGSPASVTDSAVLGGTDASMALTCAFAARRRRRDDEGPRARSRRDRWVRLRRTRASSTRRRARRATSPERQPARRARSREGGGDRGLVEKAEPLVGKAKDATGDLSSKADPVLDKARAAAGDLVGKAQPVVDRGRRGRWRPARQGEGHARQQEGRGRRAEPGRPRGGATDGEAEAIGGKGRRGQRVHPDPDRGGQGRAR